MPFVSILMATYNTDFALIKRAIDSVLCQTYSNFELIIIDDGSDNDADSALYDLISTHQNRITYLRHQNCGQSVSINRGVLLAKGDYLTILDADDEYRPEHLMLCLREMDQVDLIASTTTTIVNCEDDYFVPDKYNTHQLIHVDDCILFATLFGKIEVFKRICFETQYSADSHFYETAAHLFKVKKVDLRSYVYYRNVLGSVCDTLKKQRFPELISQN